MPSTAAQESYIGLIGGVGDRAVAIVAARARPAGLTLDSDEEFAIAFPAGTVASGRYGAHQVWLAGRVYCDERPPPSSDGLATVTDLAKRLDAGVGAESLFGAYLLISRDHDRRTVSLFHDHLSARTMYHARLGHDTLFAEHLADLLRLLPVTPAPRRVAVLQWINARTLPPGGTFYEDVARLGVGMSLELTRGDARERTIWRPRFEETLRLGQSELGEYVVDQAFAAIDRSAADLVRPGVSLSGGLDSACVAAGLGRHGDRRPLAVSRTFPGFPYADEEELIRETAAHTGLELVTAAYTDTPVVKPMYEYVRRWGIPPGSPNMTMWRPLVALARQHGVDGLLDGEGGDEVFGAWPMLIAQRVLQLRLHEAWRLVSGLPYLGAAPGRRLRLRLLRTYGLDPLAPWLIRRLASGQRAGVIAGPFVADRDAAAVLAAERVEIVRRGDGPMWWRGIVNGFVGRGVLVDSGGHQWRAGLHDGLERRHPLQQDVRLLQAMLRIAPEAQFGGARDRPTLRDGLVGRIPEAVNQRYIKGHYNDITVRALAGPDGQTLLEQLGSPDAPIREYIREGSLDILGGYASSQGLERYQLTNVLMHLGATDIWLRSLSAESP